MGGTESGGLDRGEREWGFMSRAQGGELCKPGEFSDEGDFELARPEGANGFTESREERPQVGRTSEEAWSDRGVVLAFHPWFRPVGNSEY